MRAALFDLGSFQHHLFRSEMNPQLRRKNLVKLFASVVIAAFAAAIAAAPASARNRFEGGSASVPCGDGQIVYSPTQLWPPNHKMRTITITYIDSSEPGATMGDDDGDDESLTVNSITHNQVGDDDEGGHGCGKPTDKQGPDWIFSGNPILGKDPTPIGTTVQIRGERCGKDDSPRVYTINVTCGDTDPGSNPTTVDLTVIVPHDKRHAEKVK
jgi:hypothetical protein